MRTVALTFLLLLALTARADASTVRLYTANDGQTQSIEVDAPDTGAAVTVSGSDADATHVNVQIRGADTTMAGDTVTKRGDTVMLACVNVAGGVDCLATYGPGIDTFVAAIGGEHGPNTLDVRQSPLPTLVTGGSYPDTLLGSAYSDVIWAYGGADTVDGGGGSDYLELYDDRAADHLTCDATDTVFRYVNDVANCKQEGEDLTPIFSSTGLFLSTGNAGRYKNLTLLRRPIKIRRPSLVGIDRRIKLAAPGNEVIPFSFGSFTVGGSGTTEHALKRRLIGPELARRISFSLPKQYTREVRYRLTRGAKLRGGRGLPRGSKIILTTTVALHYATAGRSMSASEVKEITYTLRPPRKPRLRYDCALQIGGAPPSAWIDKIDFGDC